MKTKQLTLGALLGGVTFFFLGWLIFGILLKPVFEANCNSSLNRPMEEMLFGPLILSNILWGLLISLCINWTQKTGLMAGLKIGGIVGIIAVSAIDLSFYSMTTFFNNMGAMMLDVLANGLLFAIAGALLGLLVFTPAKQ